MFNFKGLLQAFEAYGFEESPTLIAATVVQLIKLLFIHN